jgi:hypothetical protein
VNGHDIDDALTAGWIVLIICNVFEDALASVTDGSYTIINTKFAVFG